MEFKEGETYRIKLVFQFDKALSCDDFRYYTENELYEIGDISLEWPEDLDEFECDREISVAGDIVASVDCDQDTIDYCLNRIRKEVKDAGGELEKLSIEE
jgi:hypothetical protein